MKRLPQVAGGLISVDNGARFSFRGWSARRAVIRSLAALVAVILLCLLLATYVGWSLSHPARDPITSTPTVPYKNVSFPSAVDHLQLSGWFLDANSSKTVILVHGYTKNRLNEDLPALTLADGLLGHGYNVLMFDLRDSGQSQGSVTTIGVFEQRDVRGAVAYVQSLGAPGDHIGVAGYSMGAAATLLAAAQLHDVQAVVSDSSFADLYPYLQSNLPVWSHLPAFPFTPLILDIEPLLTGADPRKADPIDAVRRISEPILFIHGLADHSIPYSNSQKLMRAAENPQDELWLVPGADHIKSFKTDPAGYWNHLLPFLARTLR